MDDKLLEIKERWREIMNHKGRITFDWLCTVKRYAFSDIQYLLKEVDRLSNG